ncbi:MAG: OsmC family protein [Gammaproteobacteria bacterium]
MSEHRATVRWQNTESTLDYDHFSRDHQWVVKEGRLTVPASSAPAYKGNPELMDPEDALVAALASCHMLTFLAIAARRRLVVEGYVDSARGWLEPDAAGQLAVTRVELRPAVRFAPGTLLSEADFRTLHEKAHRGCFIANSVKTAVTVLPEMSSDV